MDHMINGQYLHDKRYNNDNILKKLKITKTLIAKYISLKLLINVS